MTKRAIGLLAGILLSVPALAQDNPVLPDLAPREVEITGDLTISFPSLRRQPLVGFNPPPRIPDVPDGRRPFAEPYLQRRADLPRSPLRDPAGPAVSPYSDGPRFTGSVEAGAGYYLQRYALVDVASNPSSRATWGIKGSYGGRSGFSPFTAAPGAEAAYDAGSLEARIGTRVGSWAIGGRLDGTMQSYVLYAAVPNPGAAAKPGPERVGRHGRADLSLSKDRGRVRLQLTAGLGGALYETDVFDPTLRVDPRTRRSDLKSRLGFALDVGDTEKSLYLGAQAAGVGLDGTSLTSPDVRSWQASAGARLRTKAGLRLSAGLSVLGFEATRLATNAGKRAFTWLAPDVRLDIAPMANLRLAIQNRPRVDEAGLDVVYASQPFAQDSPAIEPELWPIDASAVGTAAFGRLEFSVRTGYRLSPNRRYFEHSSTTLDDYSRGISTVSHGRAREIEAGLDVSAYLGSTTRARVGMAIRQGRLTDLDVDLPYFASWVAHTMVSTGFASNRGHVQVTGRIEGSRARDTISSLELQPFADVDIVGSYRVTRSASIVARLENIAGNRPEWDAYLRPSPLVTAGVLWQW